MREERAKLKSEECRSEADSGGDEAYANCLARQNNTRLQISVETCTAKAKASYFYEGPVEDISERRMILPEEGPGAATPAKAKAKVATPPKADADPAPAKPATAKNPANPAKANTPAAPSNNTPTQPASPQRVEDTSAAEIQADMDIASCVTTQSNASDCCNNPMACSGRLDSTDSSSLNNINNSLRSGPTNGGGLTGYCQQMNNLGHNAGNVNSGLSSICAGSHNSCSNTCRGLARKYSELLNGCDGCAAEYIYRDAIRNLTTGQNICDGLQDRSNQLALTGLGTSNNQALANYCNQVSGAATPASAGGKVAPASASPYINSILAQNCESNPNSPDCRSVKNRMGTVGFEGGGSRRNDFNVGSNDIDTETQASEGKTGLPSAAKAGAVPPNNTGGAIPNSATQASLGNTKRGPGMQTGQGADVGSGFVATSGYSQQPGSDRGEESSRGYLPMGGNGSQFENGVDLRQFLPGGRRAAARRLAGIGEINPKEEDLFIRITNKMMEKCRLGILWQCR
jgi:hypothetical protein